MRGGTLGAAFGEPMLSQSPQVFVMMRVFAFAALCSLALGQQVSAPTRTFGGYVCRHECDVHAAGFGWAQARAIEDSRQCPQGISPSFHEGCMAYIQNPKHDPDEDDEGHPVGVEVRDP
jgi:hypothetical protein